MKYQQLILDSYSNDLVYKEYMRLVRTRISFYILINISKEVLSVGSELFKNEL